MRDFHWCALLNASLGLAAIMLVMMAGDADARVVVDHDLEVTVSQVLSDETYEVHGNVTVRPGATLTLARATLEIVGEGNGTHRLEVEEGGRLLADNSTIRGFPHTVGVHLVDGCRLVTTTVEHIEAANGSRGLWLRGGAIVLDRVTVSDCPNNTGILVECNLTAASCTFSRLGTRGMQLAPTLWPVGVRLSGCLFEGSSPQPSGTTGLLLAWSAAAAQAASVTVDGCTFRGLPVGMMAQLNSSSVSLDCRGTTTDTCARGLIVEGNGARVTIDGCEVTSRGGLVGIRVHVLESSYEPIALLLRNVTVHGFERGVWVLGPSSGFSPTLNGLQVSECDVGVTVQGCPIVIVDSRVVECTYCFEVQQRGRIEVHRTEHEHMSGDITPGQEGAIVAYSDINVTSCKWLDAYPLLSGTLFLYGEDGIVLEKLDLGALAPVEVVTWSKSRWYTLGRLYVIPTYFKDGARFEAANFSIYNTSAQRVEVVDDRAPMLSGVSPGTDVWSNTSSIEVRGHLVELGTGLATFTVALDERAPELVAVGPDGNWSIQFGPLVDGRHDVALRAADRAGNVVELHIENLTVDTVRPGTVPLDGWRALWNTSLVWFSFWTEPWCAVSFSDYATTSGDNGLAAVLAYFDDGRHIEYITVTDRARNTIATRYEFIVDTKPPGITVDPPDGALLNSTAVFLKVWLLEGVHELYVNGSRVLPASEPVVGPWTSVYRAREGENIIALKAVDLAGNAATYALRWVVDSLPPVLTIIEPDRDRLYTVSDTVTLRGEVADPHLLGVTLNGKILDLLDGTFASLLQIRDGENVFTLEAEDEAGHTTVRTITVLRDTALPSCTVDIEVPAGRLIDLDGTLTATHGGLRVVFHPSEWVRISAHGGYGQANGTGPIVFELGLSEGPNEFTFSVVDEAGNVGAARSVRVTLDTTSPVVKVFEPANGTSTREATVRLRGQAEPGSTINVNGVGVPVAGDGTFSLKVDLQVGTNTFELVATDGVGLVGTLDLEVVREEGADEGPGFGAAATAAGVAAVAAAMAVWGGRREPGSIA